MTTADFLRSDAPAAAAKSAAGASHAEALRAADLSGLQVEGLSKRYGKRTVVRDVSLRVSRGEAVGLLGPNGAGKTTLFYMITGLLRPDSGRIVLDGQNVTSLPMYQRARLGVGYLPQEPSIFRGLDGRRKPARRSGGQRAGPQ